MLLKLAFLFCSGCLRWPVSCPRRKIWRSLSMIMISWLVMRKSARPSLIWRTVSCLDTTPTVAYHRLTACRQNCVWVLAGHLIQMDTQAESFFFFLIFCFLPFQFWYQPVEGPAEAIPNSGEPGSSERLVQTQDWRQRHITHLQWQRVHPGWIW